MAARGQLTVAAILVAAGAGQRLGADQPKAFVQVAGRTLLEHATAVFAEHSGVRDLVVCAPASLVRSAAQLAAGAVVVPGGDSRQASVACGLAVVADDVDTVLVHDVARAFVPAEVISRVIDALAAGATAVVPTVAVADTIRRCELDTGVLGPTLHRAGLVAVQTPQGFRRDVLAAAHAAAVARGLRATDDAALVEALGEAVTAVAGAPEAFKITQPLDLLLAERMAAR